MWLLYVSAARLGGRGMFDQCGYYMSLLQDLVEEACLISVVTICRCCKTWWSGRCWSDLNMLGMSRLGEGVVGPADHTSKLMCYVFYL